MRTTAWVSVLGLVAVAGPACETGRECLGECATAVIASGADVDVLLPPLVQSDVGFEVIQQVFLKLADLGLEMNTAGDSGFVPKLAASWEFVDSLTIRFRVDPRARWHDGVPVTAADVAFTYDVYRDSALAVVSRPLLSSIAAVQAVDEGTVEFRFTRAYAEQFYDATHHMWVLPRHLLDSVPRDRLAFHPFGRTPVGAGPYRFVQHRPGELIELAADSTFFLGPPGIARLIWRISPDFNTALTQLIAGDADIIKIITGRDNVDRARAADSLQLIEYPSAVYFYLGYNLRAPGDADRPHPLFGDRALRRAVAYGLDREAIVRAVFRDGAEVAGGPTTPAVWIWDSDRRQLPFDSARASRMLADLGWADTDGDGVRDRGGRPLTFSIAYPSSSAAREQIAVIVQAQLRRLGIAVELEAAEFNTFLDRLNTGRFDAAMGAWSVDPPPSAIRQLWTSTGIGGSNHGRYASVEFDSLVAAASRIPSKADAATVWHQAMEVINEDAPAVWLLTPKFLAGMHVRFRNVSLRPDLWAATLWTWRVE